MAKISSWPSPPAVGCLVKKGLQKGGSRAPLDPAGYALVLNFEEFANKESILDLFIYVIIFL